jgi:four helix bundle protein
MPVKSYKDLIVWKKSVTLVCDIYRMTSQFPRDERFGLTAQLRRAAVSIPSNIAEGHGRATRGEYLNALSVARGSAHEVETLILISQRLDFGQQASAGELIAEIDEIIRMLSRLHSRLREDRNRTT